MNRMDVELDLRAILGSKQAAQEVAGELLRSIRERNIVSEVEGRTQGGESGVGEGIDPRPPGWYHCP